MNPSDISNLPAYDANSLNSLKRLTRDNSPEAVHAAAKQFEAVFLGMVLKSMRDATPQDGFFDSEQTKTFQTMLDQQLAQMLVAKGSTGLAAIIEKQLGRPSSPDPAVAASSAGAAAGPAARTDVPDSRFDPSVLRRAAVHVLDGGSADPGAAAEGTPAAATPGTGSFVDKLWPHALKAGREAGIPPHFMVAQAALETGWGKSEMLQADGRPAHNLFGIKAGKDWTGPVVEKATTEYVGGVPQKTVARFRAYGSYAEAFSDYASLLKNNPRYVSVVGSQDASTFARGLQQAGYATDPMYAAKLERIISGNSLRKQLAG
ncbi:MAG: flagellar assembly peptidoglycan hydrolase FlgJ [Rhodocyclaceae bacterium]|nr:flagellar assembly peptidoglycan hydrolase FlgJ [Rhodocyclaceae bacterium]